MQIMTIIKTRYQDSPSTECQSDIIDWNMYTLYFSPIKV